MIEAHDNPLDLIVPDAVPVMWVAARSAFKFALKAESLCENCSYAFSP